jgi:hypothetical protein
MKEMAALICIASDTPFGLGLSKPSLLLLVPQEREGFDRLSPNGAAAFW